MATDAPTALQTSTAEKNTPGQPRTFEAILADLANPSPETQRAIDQRIARHEARDEAHRISKAQTALRRTIPDRYIGANLSNFDPPTPEAAAILSHCKALAAKPALLADSNLLFVGTVGTGKDHLAIALLTAAAAAGFTAEWRSAKAVYTELADAYRAEKTHAEIYRELAKPTILCLSDPIEPRNWTEAKADQLAKIIAARYDLGRATWITANLPNHNQAIELAGRETWDRLMQDATILKCTWDSHRWRPGK
jgi:DNA replication protein DnaC